MKIKTKIIALCFIICSIYAIRIGSEPFTGIKDEMSIDNRIYERGSLYTQREKIKGLNPAIEKTIYPVSLPLPEKGIIQNILNYDWNNEALKRFLPTKSSSTFNRYRNYPIKGIKVRNSETYGDCGEVELFGDIFSIIFTENFKGSILKNITMESSEKDIKDFLGEPQFKDDKLKCFGYKGEFFYIFFSSLYDKREVTVYRRDTLTDRNILIGTLNDFLEQEGNTKKLFAYGFINKLSQDRYEYDYYKSGRHSIRRNGTGSGYLGQGVKFRSDYLLEKPKIKIGGNFQGYFTQKELKSIKDSVTLKDLITLELEEDYIFQEEKKRLQYIMDIRNGCWDENLAISPDGTHGVSRSRDDYIDRNLAGISIVSLDGTEENYDFPYRWTHAGDFHWLSNRYFIFASYRYSVCVFDLKKKEIIKRFGGYNNCITEVDKGKISYRTDYENVLVLKQQEYYFDENGVIFFR